MNEGRDGDGLGVGLWGCLRYGGMYGVCVQEFSGDECRRLCPLTLHLLVMHLMHQKILILMVKIGLNRLRESISVDKTLLRVPHDEEMLTCLVLRGLLGLVSCLDLHL